MAVTRPAVSAPELTRAPPARRNNPLYGIFYLCAGVSLFSVHDIYVKLLSGIYPLSEVMLVRSITALPIMLLIVGLDVGIGAIATRRVGAVLLRAVILLIGYLTFYLGFAALPFTTAVALYSSVPIILAALSGPLLGERVGIVRWLAVMAGFAGVIIMLQPTDGVFEPASLLILTCALLYSLGMIMARRLGATTPASVMAFYTIILFLVTAVGLGLLTTFVDMGRWEHPSLAFLLRPWLTPAPFDLVLMMAAGVMAAGGIAGLTFAYREAEANLVASFEYTALVWAALWGYLIFSEVPGANTLSGAGLIVGAGLVAMLGTPARR